MKVDVIEPFEALFNPSHESYNARYHNYYGGRGAAKSHQIAEALILRGYITPLKILCTREYQNSISDSVIALLSDKVDKLGLNDFYDVQRTAVYGANGTEFLFKGLRHNIQSIKSTEGVDICWIEEAQTVSDESYKILIPTIRKPGSQIIISFNPDMDTDPTYQRFVASPPDGAHVVKVNYYDNPFFPKELNDEQEYLRRVDPDAHANVWLGECVTRSDDQVLAGKCVVDDFTPGADWDGPYFGSDFGFAQDPTTITKSWINGTTLYIEHEAGGVGIEIEDTPELYDRVPGSREHLITADSARPETISHIARRGFNIVGAKKGSGSVEDGVSFLRSFERIVIHPRCKNTWHESRHWKYKTDRLTGDVLPKLKDGNDHYWDAIRYSVEKLIKQAGARALLPERLRKQLG